MGQYFIAILVCGLSSMGAAGLPGAAVAYSDAPGMLILGALIELLPLFTAVIAIPDIFLTTSNVTGDLTLTAVVARIVGAKEQARAETVPEAA